MMKIGIDTGGTFTDFVFYDGEETKILKLPSTPDNPALAILEGLSPLMDQSFELVHGTTVSTNAFLQNKMAKTAFICSQGFQHLLYIGRQNRIKLFSLDVEKLSPLVPLSLCFGLEERTLKDGSKRTSPPHDQILQLKEVLQQQGVQAVGIVFLHSYTAPEHEQQVAQELRKAGFYVTASHEILPEYREYERAVVTVLNAALQPIIADYIHNLKDALKGQKLSIIQSNGGVLSPHRIVTEPVRTIMSGPAGGVIAARQIAEICGEPNIVTLDMGGTSTDTSLIKNYNLTLTRGGSLQGLPLRLPMIDIATVGAGGGSIARIDRGGILQVGPESAGAYPGPACYGNSDLVTVTDAFVVNGAILPETFLGGKMKIYPKKSVRALEKIAQQLGKSIFETAEGIIRISVSTMERALRSVTLEKGEDPRLYTLMPFGGAGGLVAALLTERLGIKRILIPPNQGLFSAMGMLTADFQKELIHSFLQPYTPDIIAQINPIFQSMTQEALQILAEEKLEPQIIMAMDIRYQGQSYELTIPYTFDQDADTFIKAFHQQHSQLYSYYLPDSRCEIVNLRVLAQGKSAALKIQKKPTVSYEPEVYFRKKVYFNGDFREFYVYRRHQLMPGHEMKTPAIITSDDATIIVPDRYKATVDVYSNILLQALSSGRSL